MPAQVAGGTGMAQYPGTSLTGIASPLDTCQPLDADDQLGRIVGQIHEYQVPPSVSDAIDRLYGSLYASSRFQRVCDPSALPHVWVAYQRGDIVGALLFRTETSRIQVLSEMFMLDSDIAAAFCRDVFGRYQEAREINFNAICLPARLPRLVCQHFAFSENYVLELPASVGEYEQSLGKSTRKTLRGYGNRLLREHPHFVWRSGSCSTLSPQAQQALVRQLQVFKCESMAARGRQAKADARETAQLLRMTAECGWFGMGTVDGKLCAGSLALRIGENYVMMLCAADPAYSSYRLGLLACYWSLCDCIRQGGRQCHLLWGRYRYKEQLLAAPIPLHRLRVYRSRWQMLCRPFSVTGMAASSLLHRCRSWWLDVLPEQLARQEWLVRGVRHLLRQPEPNK
jgi:Acetyltransferase (GNAT) domain